MVSDSGLGAHQIGSISHSAFVVAAKRIGVQSLDIAALDLADIGNAVASVVVCDVTVSARAVVPVDDVLLVVDGVEVRLLVVLDASVALVVYCRRRSRIVPP